MLVALALGDRYRVEREGGEEPLGGSGLNRRSSLGHAYAIAGRIARARSVLAELRTAAARAYVPSYYFAVVYTGLGERDQALRYLERAYEERSTVLAYLWIDPRLAPLREEPRFLAWRDGSAGSEP